MSRWLAEQAQWFTANPNDYDGPLVLDELYDSPEAAVAAVDALVKKSADHWTTELAE